MQGEWYEVEWWDRQSEGYVRIGGPGKLSLKGARIVVYLRRVVSGKSARIIRVSSRGREVVDG